MIHILFVDDEPDLLSGLRRGLRSQRKLWNMHFAVGGKEALSKVAEIDFDLVITDMRMPEMNGATLLEKVYEVAPHTIRVLLSGQSDKESTLQAIGISHQFWAKPFDTEAMITKIEELVSVRNRLKKVEWYAINAMHSIPSPAPVLNSLKTELLQSSPDINVISEIVGSDVGLSSKLVQLTNSAYFGTGNTILVPGDAVRFLGVDLMQELIKLNGFSSVVDTESTPLALGTLEKISEAADLGENVGLKIGMEKRDWSLARQVCKFFMLGSALKDTGIIVSNTEEFAVDDGQYLAALWGFPSQLYDLLSIDSIKKGGDLSDFSRAVLAIVFPEFSNSLSPDDDPHLVMFKREIEAVRATAKGTSS
ncbi:response regulator [Kiloniella majae]|uniref:response regulator n=1 Tax=Kiloniella majae TaxID=1938558 RepID=UPI000A27839D|nr:response regulator [Kiloniella majae]